MAMNYAVLVSGGVDSAVALHQLVRRADGPVTAYYLKIWLEDEMSFLGSCPWEEDLSYARDVCRAAGVALEVVPLQREYYERVVSYTVDELRAGRTPSPDIFCNQRIKFGAFMDAVGDSADRVVTGHYAQVRRTGGGAELLQAPDPVKDQTYFLSHLSQSQLARAEFPVGSLTKREVRQQAAQLGLSNRDRPDSQGICFLGKIRYRDFVRHYLGTRSGPILEAGSGRRLGEHEGAWFYTIGQRQGLGLGNGPWYVVRRDVRENVVEVAHAEGVAGRARSTFRVGALHWINAAPALEGQRGLSLKLRHGPEMVGCHLEDRNGQLQVSMERADRGVAAGQFAVFYRDGVCLGSGMILEEDAA
mgnify:FL=1